MFLEPAGPQIEMDGRKLPNCKPLFNSWKLKIENNSTTYMTRIRNIVVPKRYTILTAYTTIFLLN
jgi:hypothetical protein